MPIDFQTALGVHEQALYTRARRTEVLGANMANTDTPGYKARDIDFRQAVAGAFGRQTKIAGQGQLQPAAQAYALMGGDDRLFHRFEFVE